MNNVVTQRFITCLGHLLEKRIVRSNRQFALSLDYLPQSLSEIMKGRRDVTIELIRKACATYRINSNYIFCGEGPLILGEEGSNSEKLLTIVTDNLGEEKIIHVPVPAQAGYASSIADPVFVSELPAYSLPDYRYKVGTHRSFDVDGDSMEPTLFKGDKVVCSNVEQMFWQSSIKDNNVYVIVTKGDILVKRVVNKLKDNKQLKLISDNDYYEPFTMEANEIVEIWYVQAKISPFLASPQNARNDLSNEIQDLKKQIAHQNRLIYNLNLAIEKFVDHKEHLS